MQSEQGEPRRDLLALPDLGPRRVLVLASVAALGLALVVALVAVGRTATSPSAAIGAADVVPSSGALPDCRYLDPAGRDLRVMFVGDSMTQGRSGSATYRYWTWKGLTSQRDDVDFVGPITELNGRAGINAYEHLDAGFSDQREHAARGGATFESNRAEFPPLRMVEQFAPDVIVLQLGFNDSNTRLVTPEQLAAMSERYVDTVWSVAPSTRFVIGEIPPAEGKPGKEEIVTARNQRTAAANELVHERWADQPCKVAVTTLRSDPSRPWNPAVDTYDGAHPGPGGETLMADRMLAGLARIGVTRESVRVYDPDETWAPDPQVELQPLGGGKVRVDWAAESARLSAEGLRLRVVDNGNSRDTAWFTRTRFVIDLEPGEQGVSAIVSRGLPGRMVSEPGTPQQVVVR